MRWPGRRDAPAATPSPEPPASRPAPSTVPVALRPPTVPHHWLTIVVARPGPSAPLPIPGARVVVRTFPREAARPGVIVARGAAGVDGSVAFFLPAGRYAVSASEGTDARAATLTLEHAGRAVLVLQGAAPRVVLTVEAVTAEGAPAPGVEVDVRVSPSGTAAAKSVTDERGVAAIPLVPGAYEVRVGDSSAKTYVEADTAVRLRAHARPPSPSEGPVSRYAQRARAATASIAPLDTEWVREETWN